MKGHIIENQETYEDIEFNFNDIRNGPSNRAYKYYQKLFKDIDIPYDTDRFTQLNTKSYLVYKDKEILDNFLKIIRENNIYYELGYVNTFAGHFYVIMYLVPDDFN